MKNINNFQKKVTNTYADKYKDFKKQNHTHLDKNIDTYTYIYIYLLICI